jgi:hypothetical protein
MTFIDNQCVHLSQARMNRIQMKKVKSRNDPVANVLYTIVPTASSRVDCAFHTELSARRVPILDARKTSKREDCAAHMDLLVNVASSRDVQRWLCRVVDA